MKFGALIIGITIAWAVIPEDEFIIGTTVEISVDDGRTFELLAVVPYPDTVVVIPDPPLGARILYRGFFFSSGGNGPYGRLGSALYLDFSGGLETLTRDVSYSFTPDSTVLLVVYRPSTPWISSWRGPGDPRGPETIIYKSELDFNRDGIHNLSDLSFADGMGTAVFLALLEVYGTPALYEWRAE